MAKIINIENSPKYRFTCKNCKTLAEYDVYEIQKLKAVGKWNKEIPKASN